MILQWFPHLAKWSKGFAVEKKLPLQKRNAHKIVDLIVDSIDTAPIFTTIIDHGFCWLIISFDDHLWLFIVQIISAFHPL
jgi:hypothetical protein